MRASGRQSERVEALGGKSDDSRTEDPTMRVIGMIIALSFSLGGVMSAAASAQEPAHHYQSALSAMAPADEYFGRLKESVIEIRNRLDELDRRSDSDMLDPDTIHYLDDLQDAIRDWQHKYPRDPWLPGFLHRLVRDYERAGAASSPQGLETLALLETNYPDTDVTLTANDDTAPQVQNVSIEGVVVDADSGEPIVGAVITVTSSDGTPDASGDPFGTTADDGSFVVADLPATVLSITVQPPQDSGYAPCTLTVDGSAGDVDAGVIRLSAE